GCSFPGCGRAPEWCERHHIKDWARGGLTDLNNLTLLCRWHHHNFAQRGWTCRIRDDGLPEWIPPKWVDREQKPLQNSRIIAHLIVGKGRQSGRSEHSRRRPPTPAPCAQPEPAA
ncbi:MAG: HNH endonuclease, partial [Propionibacteriaceae bacterium]